MITTRVIALHRRPVVLVEYPDGCVQKFGPFATREAARTFAAEFVTEIQPYWPEPTVTIPTEYPREWCRFSM